MSYNKEEFPPLLDEGFHRMSLRDVEQLCVAHFPLSATRKEIMAGLEVTLKKIAASGITGEVWLNGSFITQKIDPTDSDIVAMIPATFYEAGTDEQRDIIDWLNSRDDEPKKLFKCDAYVHLKYETGTPEEKLWETTLARWQRLYGFGPVTGKPKGIVVLHLGEMHVALMAEYERAALRPGSPASLLVNLRSLEKLKRQLEREFEDRRSSWPVFSDKDRATPHLPSPESSSPTWIQNMREDMEGRAGSFL